MNIRPANIVDLERCARLDGSYRTQHVWQMSERVDPESISVSFQRVRIPRQIEVGYPRGVDSLQDDWQRGECFLVADELGLMMGYLDVVVSRWQWRASVEHLIVDRARRRQGIATRLITAAETWARGSELNAMTAAVQSKNDPAISLLLRRGYAFSGYVDKYYPNGDAAVVYSLQL